MNVDHLRSTWERLGQHDPLWAVVSDPARKDGKWDLDEFLSTGQRVISGVADTLDTLSMGFGDHVLDFGCGVGRLSFALAERVRTVTGVDIASSMIDYATRLNQEPDRIRFEHYDGRLLPFGDDTFDSVLSLIVLQHVPPPVQVSALMELRRVVRPGGVLVVQIPARRVPPPALPESAMRAELTIGEFPSTMSCRSGHSVPVSITNRGTEQWPVSRGIRVGNHWRKDGDMVVVDDGRGELPRAVAPGSTVHIDLWITAPDVAGSYELELDLVQESVAWWGQVGSDTARMPVDVIPAPAVTEGGTETSLPELDTPAQMEMFAMGPELVRALLAHAGCTVLAAIPDDQPGAEWDSYTYIIGKD